MIKLSDLTQHQKILMVMCNNKDQEWFLPTDFMKDGMGDLFVGYEASARLSELASENPDMIESQQAGKYIKRRIRWEAMPGWFEGLPKHLRYIFHRSGLTKDLKSEAPLEPTPPPPKPKAGMKVIAEYVGMFEGEFGIDRRGADYGSVFELEIDRLEFGAPVKLLAPKAKVYDSITAFYRDWKILKKGGAKNA